MSQNNSKLALVLSGGGARGAYEAGIIHYIRSKMPKHIARQKPFDILCGSSVGAINICFLAATSHDLDYQASQSHQIWTNLKQENIYRRDVSTFTKFILNTATGITRNFFGRKDKNFKRRGLTEKHFKGLFDTTPFHKYLNEIIPWNQIRLNIQNGMTKALSITTTNVHSGKLELFIDKHPSIEYTGRHEAHFGPISCRHAIASAAIPFLFPSVNIGSNYYCDGGLRLNTPMSPALHMGADKILVLGLHHVSEKAEERVLDPDIKYDVPPTMGEMIGNVLKTIFVDRLDYDLAQLGRINQLVKFGTDIYGSDFVSKLNNHIIEKGYAKDLETTGLKQIGVMSIFPSRDIRTLFSESIQQTQYLTKNLTTFEKTLLKVLDVDLESSIDFLTYILFIPPYIKKLLDLGYEDAKAHHDELIKFLED